MPHQGKCSDPIISLRQSDYDRAIAAAKQGMTGWRLNKDQREQIGWIIEGNIQNTTEEMLERIENVLAPPTTVEKDDEQPMSIRKIPEGPGTRHGSGGGEPFIPSPDIAGVKDGLAACDTYSVYETTDEVCFIKRSLIMETLRVIEGLEKEDWFQRYVDTAEALIEAQATCERQSRQLTATQNELQQEMNMRAADLNQLNDTAAANVKLQDRVTELNQMQQDTYKLLKFTEAENTKLTRLLLSGSGE